MYFGHIYMILCRLVARVSSTISQYCKLKFGCDLISKYPTMELERKIFNFAKDGELDRLISILDNKPKYAVSLLVSARTDNSTPLVEACANDDLEVASYLIEECLADTEQVGSTILDGEDVNEAPPLWYAAGSGNLNLVKCLVEHGADIETTSDDGTTCLMSACLGGHYEVSEYLIECGADVNRKCKYGSTALQCCLELEYLDILMLLGENGAILFPTPWDESPLLYAAENGQEDFVEYFLEEFTFTKQEQINALEVLGATLAIKNQDRISALDCWRRAMEMRYDDRDCLIEKPPSTLETRSTTEACLDVTEFRTLSQLEDIMSNPDEMEIQALVIRDRILGPGCLSANLFYIENKGRSYAENGDFDRCVQLWMCALKIYPARNLLNFLTNFSVMMSDVAPFATGYSVVHFHNILRAFERVVKEIERTKIPSCCSVSHKHETIFIALFLLGLICRLLSRINKSEELELKGHAYKLARTVPEILHCACCEEFSFMGVFELQNSTSNQLEVINLLLEVGASPNALNCNQDTPLHLAAGNKLCPEAVFLTLLNYGAHLDQCNRKNQTPLQLAQHMSLLDVYPLQHVNLQCLSAKAIHRHKIPYKGLVHKKLETFVDSH